MSQAVKLADTNVIAITDAKLNLVRSIKVEVFSVDSENSHEMQLTVVYLYTGVHISEVLRTIFYPRKCSLF